jgi:hypothetical protein
MSDESRSLTPGAIKDRQISGQAKIKHGKLAQVADAQVLVGGSDKKLSARTVSGDATLANDGTLTLDDAKLETRVKAVLTDLDIESGSQKNIKADEIKKIYEEIPGVNRFTNRYDEDLRSAGDANLAGTLVKRDDSGDISVGTVTGNLTGTATTATTAATATNADKLDDQEGTHYLDVTNHTAGTATSLGVPENSVGVSSATKQGFPKIVYEANTGGGSNSYFTIPHALGYIPQVTIMHGVLDGSNTVYKEIDAEVESSNSQTIVRCSEQGLNLKVYLT